MSESNMFYGRGIIKIALTITPFAVMEAVEYKRNENPKEMPSHRPQHGNWVKPL